MRQAVEFQSRAAILHSDFGETKSIPSMTSLRNFLALKPCSPRGIRDAIWFLSLDCSRLKTQPGLNRKCVPLFHGICHPRFWDLKPGYPKTLPNKYGPHWHLVTTSLTASQGNCWDLLAVSCCSATSRQTFSWFSWSSSPSLLKNLDKLRRKTQCSTWTLQLYHNNWLKYYCTNYGCNLSICMSTWRVYNVYNGLYVSV
jgi:hypothetical protein